MLSKLTESIQKALKDIYGKIDVSAEMKDGTFNVDINILAEKEKLINPIVFENKEERV